MRILWEGKNMIPILLIIVGIFLLIFSIIDWKVKNIPSIILTGTLFVVAFLNPSNLWFGIMGFIVAYLLFEADFFSGIADVKVMTILTFLIGTTRWFLFFLVLTVILGFIWKLVLKWKLKKEKIIAFIPVFLVVYLIMLILGGIK